MSGFLERGWRGARCGASRKSRARRSLRTIDRSAAHSTPARELGTFGDVFDVIAEVRAQVAGRR